MNLVIVESPSKAKTIKKYLGKGYVVKASKGHVVDLPKSQIGVDVDKKFEPTYVVTKEQVLKELKKDYKGVDELILAVDLDREGEAIAWHLGVALGALTKDGNPKKGKTVKRIVFSEITKDAIQAAIKEPRSINMDLVNAQQARRVLDRLVGYKLSPVLWKKIQFGLSAGRVQSVALRLIVEREDERDAFKPEEYWSLYILGKDGAKSKSKSKINIWEKETKSEGDLAKEKELIAKEELIKFDLFKISGKKFEESEKGNVEKVIADIKDQQLEVTDVTKKNSKRNPGAPFTTSTLQQAAVNRLGFTSKRTMSVAQKLYEAGHITYMRTDSTTMSASAMESARGFIKKNYGDKYLPEKPRHYSKQSKNSQEAHECVRPANFEFTGAGLTPEQQKLYDLIYNRTVASQMNPAEVENITVTTKIKEYEFKAVGSRVVFDGYLKLYKERVSENILPVVNIGDKFSSEYINSNQHFTQPPARFSEASIIKKLEELGIGRPSTYSSIISTIQSRRYVEKEGRYLFPTDVGKVVCRLLVKYFKNIMDYSFTSGMEDKLDDIAEGKQDWIKMLTDFYKPFEKEVKATDDKIPRDEFTVLGEAPSDVKCPICKSKMIIKLSRKGKFYSCTKFPECIGKRGMDGRTDEDVEKEAHTEEFKKQFKSAPKTDDGRDYLLRNGRFGQFWAHPDYPKVKDAQPLELKKAEIRKLYGEAPKTDDGRDYLLRNGKFGPFWAHPDYPKVKDIQKVKKKPAPQPVAEKEE